MTIHTRLMCHRPLSHLGLGPALLVVAFLSACGGGGGGNDEATTTFFPLEEAYQRSVEQGSDANYTVIGPGNCAGTARLVFSAARPTTVEGEPPLVVAETVKVDHTHCTPVSSTTTSQTFYSLDRNPIATWAQNNLNGPVVTEPGGLPSRVKAGDVGKFASQTLYSDIGRSDEVGRVQVDYVIAADTDISALVTIISRGYDTAGNLLVTQQTRYRLGSDGSFKALYFDLKGSTTSVDDFVFRLIQ